MLVPLRAIYNCMKSWYEKYTKNGDFNALYIYVIMAKIYKFRGGKRSIPLDYRTISNQSKVFSDLVQTYLSLYYIVESRSESKYREKYFSNDVARVIRSFGGTFCNVINVEQDKVSLKINGKDFELSTVYTSKSNYLKVINNFILSCLNLSIDLIIDYNYINMGEYKENLKIKLYQLITSNTSALL